MCKGTWRQPCNFLSGFWRDVCRAIWLSLKYPCRFFVFFSSLIRPRKSLPSTGENSKQLVLNLSRILSLRILAATGTGHRRLGRDTEAAHPANLNHYSTWCSPALVCTFRFNTGGATSGRIRCCSFGRINECKLQVWLHFPTCIRSADINTDVAVQSIQKWWPELTVSSSELCRHPAYLRDTAGLGRSQRRRLMCLPGNLQLSTCSISTAAGCLFCWGTAGETQTLRLESMQGLRVGLWRFKINFCFIVFHFSIISFL